MTYITELNSSYAAKLVTPSVVGFIYQDTPTIKEVQEEAFMPEERSNTKDYNIVEQVISPTHLKRVLQFHFVCHFYAS